MYFLGRICGNQCYDHPSDKLDLGEDWRDCMCNGIISSDWPKPKPKGSYFTSDWPEESYCCSSSSCAEERTSNGSMYVCPNGKSKVLSITEKCDLVSGNQCPFNIYKDMAISATCGTETKCTKGKYPNFYPIICQETLRMDETDQSFTRFCEYKMEQEQDAVYCSQSTGKYKFYQCMTKQNSDT